jgi:ABC-type lipoprotein export system ATPase subunit
MVFQDHKLLDDRSVFENVSLPLVIAGVNRREIERRVRAALDQARRSPMRHGRTGAASWGASSDAQPRPVPSVAAPAPTPGR